MSEVLARGVVEVKVQQDVERELRKAEAAFDRAMANMDGKEASLELDANLKPLQRKLKEAEAKVDEYSKKEATATLDVDAKRARANLRKWERELEKRRVARDSVELDTSKARAQLALLQKLERDRVAEREKLTAIQEKQEERLVDSMAKGAGKRARASMAAYESEKRASAASAAARIADEKKAADAAIKERDRIQKAVNKGIKNNIAAAIKEADVRVASEERAAKAAERTAAKIGADADRAAARSEAAMERDRQNVAALELAYAKLFKRKQALERQNDKVFLPNSVRTTATLESAHATEQMLALRARLAAIGHDPVEIHARLSVDDRDHGTASLAKFAAAITDTTVRVGPFTTTIAGVGRALALLGPIIAGVIGTVGALTGAVGAAAIGFGGLALGGLASFGLVLGSTVPVVASLMRDFKNLNTFQDAYHKQVLKTGEGSEKAKKKLKELNHAIAEVGPGAREAYTQYDKLQDSWRNMSKAARPAFLKSMGEGFKTANTLLKDFSGEITQSSNLVAHGASVMFKALRSDEAKKDIQSLFDSGQKAMPAFGRGLANIGRSMANLSVAFAKALPSMGGGFEAWSKKLLDFTQNGDKLSNFVKKTTGALRSLGHFLQSGTMLLGRFFGAGVGPGAHLLDDMADGMDRISTSGANDFFKQSIATTKQLYSALLPLGKVFMEWATIMQPFTENMLAVVGVVGQVVTAMAGFGPTKAILRGAFALFLGGMIAGKIAGVIGGIRTLIGVMRTMGASTLGFKALDALLAGFPSRFRKIGQAQKAAAAVTAGTTAVEASGSALNAAMAGGAGAAAARTTAKELERVTARQLIMGTSAMAAGEAVAGLATAFATAAAGAVVVGGAIGYFGTKLLMGHTAAHKLNEDLNNAAKNTENYGRVTKAMAGTYSEAGAAQRDYKSSMNQVIAAKRHLNWLESQGKKGSAEYNSTLDTLNGALAERARNEGRVQKAMQAASTLQQTHTKQSNDMFEQETKLADAQKKVATEQDHLNKARAAHNGPAIERAERSLANAEKEVAARTKSVADAQRAVRQANDAAVVGAMNYQRALQNMIPLAGKAAASLASLARKNPNVAAKISVKYADPKDAGNVARKAQSALGKGVTLKTVMKIVADSKNADQALKRLGAAVLKTKIQKITETGSTQAMGKLQRLIGVKMSDKKFRAMLNDLASGKITHIQGMKITDKRLAAILRDLASSGLSHVIGLANSIPASRTTVLTTILRTLHQDDGREAKRGRAAGRNTQPGREVALIGEGNAPEWRVNAKTGLVQRVEGPMMASLNTSDYIIPTEARYAARGRDLLSQVAKDLNVPGYAGGKAATSKPKTPAKSSPKTPAKATPGKDKGKSKLPTVEKRYVYGGAPLDEVSSESTKAAGNLRGRNRKLTTAKAAVDKAKANEKKVAKQKNANKKNSKGVSPMDTARDKTEAARKKVDILTKGNPKALGENNPDRDSLKMLDRKAKLAAGRLKAVREIDNKIKKATALANRDSTMMEKNATLYNNTGDPKYLTEWTRLKKDRESQLAILKKLYEDAAKYAKPGSAFKSEMLDNAATADNDITQSIYTETPSAKALSLEDYIRNFGRLPELLTLRQNESLAKYNTPRVDDDPNTEINERAESLKDDLTAASAVVDFYESVYKGLKDIGAPMEVQTEALDAILSARDSLNGIKDDVKGGSDSGSSNDPVPSASLARDTERYTAMKTYGSNAFSGEALTAAGVTSGASGMNAGVSSISPGATLTGESVGSGLSQGAAAGAALASGGSGGSAGRGTTSSGEGVINKSVTVNNSFAVPPTDPLTWSRGVQFETGAML